MSYFSIAYNTKRLRRADGPKTYDDLLNPKWKAKIAWPILCPSVQRYSGTNLRLAWATQGDGYLPAPRQTELVNLARGNPRTLVSRHRPANTRRACRFSPITR